MVRNSTIILRSHEYPATELFRKLDIQDYEITDISEVPEDILLKMKASGDRMAGYPKARVIISYYDPDELTAAIKKESHMIDARKTDEDMGLDEFLKIAYE